MLQWFSFVLISSCQIFRIAVNNTNVIRSLRKVPDTFVGVLPKFGLFFPHVVMHNLPIQSFTNIHPVGAALAHTDRRKDSHDEGNGSLSRRQRTRLKTNCIFTSARVTCRRGILVQSEHVIGGSHPFIGHTDR